MTESKAKGTIPIICRGVPLNRRPGRMLTFAGATPNLNTIFPSCILQGKEVLRAQVYGPAMTASSHEICRVILKAVAEDYQSFESIVGQVSGANPEYGSGVEIEHLLLSLLASNLAGAYLLHADPPYATPVESTPEMIRTYWFCITEQGRKFLDMSAREQISSRDRERPRPAAL